MFPFPHDDHEEEQKYTMWEEPPLTRSLEPEAVTAAQQFHSLNEPVMRGGHFGGVAVMPAHDLSNFGAGGFGAFEENPLSFWDSVSTAQDLSIPAWPTDPLQKPTGKQLHEELALPSFAAPTGKDLYQALPAFSLVTDLSKPSVAPLEPVPIFLEKYTSYRSTAAPAKVLTAFTQLFEHAADVDFSVKTQMNQIKAVLTDSRTSAQCHFRVQLYQDAKDVVVEFQRRSGCAVTFSRFIQRVVADLPQDVVVVPFVEPSTLNTIPDSAELSLALDALTLAPVSLAPVSLVAEPVPEPCSFDAEQITLDRDTIDNLLVMAASTLVDVQREALCVLVGASCTAANQKAILARAQSTMNTVLTTLEQTLSSPDAQVRSAASHLLRNLCSQAELREQVASTLCDKMATAMTMGEAAEGDVDLDTCATKRQLADTFASLAPTHARALRRSGVDTTLRGFLGCADVRLRETVESTLQVLAQ